jgi:hypothetical protein
VAAMEVALGVWAGNGTAASSMAAQRSNDRGLPGWKHLIGSLLAIAYDRICATFDSPFCRGEFGRRLEERQLEEHLIYPMYSGAKVVDPFAPDRICLVRV